jgi:DeoR family transcriptional regulator of aga operon
MPGSKALKRQEYIRNILETRGEVSAKDLAERLRVSVWTIRRDLNSLENCGVLKRYYGGADSVRPVADASLSIGGSSFRVYANINQEAKQCIGVAAARLIHYGERLALAGGTTTLEVAKALRRSRFRGEVVTNALDIALELSEEPDIRVISTGGDVLPRYHTMVGADTEHMLKLHHFDVAVIGVTGISALGGISVNSQVDATALELMVEHSTRTILVADHSKFGRVCFAPFSPTVPIDTLVTDEPLTAEYEACLQAMKIQVVVAEKILQSV